MGKMYEGMRVMDEMVYDAIFEFAKAYFESFNNYIELNLKNQNDMATLQIDNIKAFQTDFVEISKLQLENLDAIKNNQIDLNSKFDILIQQNERLIDLLSNNTSQIQNNCPECGNTLPSNAKFCTNCGTKF